MNTFIYTYVPIFASLLCLLAPLRTAHAAAPQSVDSHALTSNTGTPLHLKDAAFAGKVLLIVNTASKCGYTPQYTGLQKLHETYGPRGLVVLGFPSNDFGGQEPGTDAEIKTFCSNNYKVDFPLFAKGPVSGANAQPLFQTLRAQASNSQEIKWNFEKFLLGRNHTVIGRFGSNVSPLAKDMVAAIEKALDAL